MLNTVIIDYRPLPKYRVMDYDGLKYQLRAIEENMPFIKKVIITCLNKDDLPYYVNEDKVEIVEYHRFIPQDKCPNYNKNVVEIYLSSIKNIGEEYLYMTECVFPLKELNNKDFISNGRIRQRFEKIDSSSLYPVDTVSSTLAETTTKGTIGKTGGLRPNIPIRVGISSMYNAYIEKRKELIDFINKEYEGNNNVCFTYMEVSAYRDGRFLESTLNVSDIDNVSNDTDILWADPSKHPMTVMEWIDYKEKVTKLLADKFTNKSKYEADV